jgi:ribose/xylose/arabinose/galactoside ABC-type transport system permease subunit
VSTAAPSRPDAAASGGRQGFLGRLLGHHPDTGLLLSTLAMLAVLILVFSFTAERFFSQAVMINVLTQMSIYVIAGVGMTIVLTSGGIDISIGSIIGLVATIMGILMMDMGMPAIVAILAAFVAGATCGAFNGFLVAYVKVPPIIVTLGTLTFFRGLAYLLGDGKVYMRFPDPLPWIGDGRLFGLPVPVYIAALTVIWGQFFLGSTRMGRRITAVGGNEEAARLAGIDVVRTKLWTYVIMGILTGLTTIVIVARQDAAQAVMGFGIELHVIAAVILGGTSLFGGRGLVLGTVLGALILGVLNTGLLLSGVVQFWQLVALGLLLIAVVAVRMAREGTETK